MNLLGKYFLEHAGDYQRQFTWLGHKIVQYPSDIVALQEIIWRCKPQVIIETGVAYGGSALFYASMLELIGEGEVFGIDVDLSNAGDIITNLAITFIRGSSVDPEVSHGLAELTINKRVMVVLDSLHHEEHVTRELELWAPLVSIGQYLVVCDTSLKDLHLNCLGYPLPANVAADDNPKTSVEKFLRQHAEFKLDAEIECKLIFTAMPGGYLRRVR